MNAKQLAARLHGTDRTGKMDKELLQAAARAGLVVVYGESDDLMELRGAIEDEAGCYEGGEILLDRTGILPSFEDANHDDETAMRDWFDRKRLAAKIEAHWAAPGPFVWTYTTTIPHETFDMNDDGQPYCRGIVFAVADLLGAA